MTEDDIRRIIREELERVRVLPIYTTPQPWPQATPAPYMPPGHLFAYRRCPNGCQPGQACGNAACPLRLQIT